MNRVEAEQILLALTGGVRPRRGELLVFTDEGFKWLRLSEVEALQPLVGEDLDEQV